MPKITGFVVLLAIFVVVVGVLSAQSEQSANGQALVQTGRPDWAYGIPSGPRPPRPAEDGTVFSLPDTDGLSRAPRFAVALQPTGIPVTIPRPCLTLLRTVVRQRRELSCGRVHSVTTQMGRDVRRTPVSRVCQFRISSSRWTIFDMI